MYTDINRIPGSRLLISRLPGKALRTLVESRCQQAFSKPCLVNLISKDTQLLFSIYMYRSRLLGKHEQDEFHNEKDQEVSIKKMRH